MPYQTKKGQRAGKGFPHLSQEKKLFTYREAIEKGTQHKGADLVFLIAMYNEMQGHYGNPPIKEGCTGCVVQVNKMLRNWFGLYEKAQQTGQVAYAAATLSKVSDPYQDTNLVPINEKRDILEKESWGTLKTMFMETVPGAADKYKELNAGKRPSKEMLINELLKV